METLVIVLGSALAVVVILAMGAGVVMFLRDINVDIRLEAEVR